MKFGSRVRAITACTLIGGCMLNACSPTFNWREVRPPDADGLVAWFPCKPDTAQRVMAWPGVTKATVTVLSCKADGVLWALRYTRLPDAAQLGPTLAWWNEDVNRRAGYKVSSMSSLSVAGMTPQPEAKSWHLVANAPPGDGGQTSMHGMAWHFSHGLVVFQASVWRSVPFENISNGEDVVLTFQKGFHFSG